MSSFLLLLLFLRHAHAQSVCMWGQSDSNAGLNGLYSYNAEYNGANSYIKTIDSSCSPSTYYLYLAADSTWIIHVTHTLSLSFSPIDWTVSTLLIWCPVPQTELQSSSSYTYYARCSSSDLSNCGTSGDWEGASSLYAMEGSCPSWEVSVWNVTFTPMQLRIFNEVSLFEQNM